MCFVHCSQQINVGCRVVLCEPVPPVASLLYLHSFFVSSNQPRHLGPAQPCHRCDVLSQQTLNRALLFPIFLIANRARHPFIDLMASSRLEPNLLAGLQKCPDLFQAQFFCVLHAYLQSQACEIQSPSGSCCVINTVALQAHPALYKTQVGHQPTGWTILNPKDSVDRCGFVNLSAIEIRASPRPFPPKCFQPRSSFLARRTNGKSMSNI